MWDYIASYVMFSIQVVFLVKNIVVVYFCLIPYKQINKCCVSQCVPPVTKHLQKGEAWDGEALAFNQSDPMHKLMHQETLPWVYVTFSLKNNCYVAKVLFLLAGAE